MKIDLSQLEPTQREKARDDQVKNSAGGYVFAVDMWMQLQRFLMLGITGGTYYVGERDLLKKNIETLKRCINADWRKTLDIIVDVSVNGRAAKMDPTLVALAAILAHGPDEAKRAVAEELPKAVRTGTHILNFVDYVSQLRRWGRAARRAIASWYQSKDPDGLAFQMCKYWNRGGWTHRDVLRMAHVKPPTDRHNQLFRWAVGKEHGKLPEVVGVLERAKAAQSVQDILNLLDKYPWMPWEFIPTNYLGYPAVWEALIPRMPMTALIRNLGRMTANGLLAPFSNAVNTVADKLYDGERIRKARVHPITVLAALTTYKAGHGARGKLRWEPVPQVVDALDSAFYAAFGNVEPTGKRTLLALDVSESMTWGNIAGIPGLTPNIAATAMAMVTARTESQYYVMGFAHTFRNLGITAKDTLESAMKKTRNNSFGGTDCSLPMIWARDNSVPVDVFVVYTDSETWAGRIHPYKVLQSYRRKTGIPAMLFVVGMTADEFTIADPNDAGMLDLVGFDTGTPAVISTTVRSFYDQIT